MRRRLGFAAVRVGEAAHPGPSDLKLQRQGALAPQGTGRGALGRASQLGGFPDAAAADGTVPGRGQRLLHLRRADGVRLAWSAEAARTCVHLSPECDAGRAFLATFGPPPRDGPLVTPLSQLRRKRPWGQYAPARDDCTGAALAAAYYGGEVGAPGRELGPVPRRSKLRVELARNVRVATTEHDRYSARLEVYVHSSGRAQWRGTTTPDAVCAAHDAHGSAAELLLGHAVALVYEVSPQQGPSVDNSATVLEALIAGVILEACREVRRRELAASGAAVPAGLQRPVLVACLPTGWRDVCPRDDRVSARVWRLSWTPTGARYERSPALTVHSALGHVYDAVA